MFQMSEGEKRERRKGREKEKVELNEPVRARQRGELTPAGGQGIAPGLRDAEVRDVKWPPALRAVTRPASAPGAGDRDRHCGRCGRSAGRKRKRRKNRKKVFGMERGHPGVDGAGVVVVVVWRHRGGQRERERESKG